MDFTIKNGELIIRFTYNRDLIDTVKGAGAKFNDNIKAWLLPVKKADVLIEELNEARYMKHAQTLQDFLDREVEGNPEEVKLVVETLYPLNFDRFYYDFRCKLTKKQKRKLLLGLKAPYHKPFIEAIKEEFPPEKRYYNNDKKYWRVTVEPATLRRVISRVEEDGEMDVSQLMEIVCHLEALYSRLDRKKSYLSEAKKQRRKAAIEKKKRKREEQELKNKLEAVEPKYRVNATLVDNDAVEVSLPYDTELIDIIRNLPKAYRSYNVAMKTWLVDSSVINELINKMKEVGEDVSSLEQAEKAALEKKKRKHEEQELKSEPEVVEPKSRVNATLVDNDTVEVSLPYDTELIDIIRNLPKASRSYNRDKKTWLVDSSVINELIDDMKDVGEDVSSLEQAEKDIEEIAKNVVQIKEQAQEAIRLRLLDSSKGLVPYGHQLEAAQFLVAQQKCVLGDEMGGGKTLSAILAGNLLGGQKLVVCPASVKMHWKREIERTGRTATVINGKSKSKKSSVVDEDTEYVIIDYDILHKQEELISNQYQIVVFDEAHYIKSINTYGKPSSKRAKAALEISQRIPYVWLLTGTPMANRPADLFNLLKAADHKLSRDWFWYAKTFCNGHKTRWGYDYSGGSNLEELHNKLGDVLLRRLKEEMVELPEKIRGFIPVIIKEKEYNKKLQEYLAASPATNAEHLVYINAMRHLLAVAKTPETIKFLDDLLHDNGEKIVVMTNYQAVVDSLMEHYGEKAVKLTGSDSQEAREEAIEKFQNDSQVKVFVGNIKAAGVGITLTAANVLVFNDLDWVPATHLQAEDRIHRIGQDRKANIYYMSAENISIDDLLAQTIEEKTKVINTAIDGGKEGQNEKRILKKIIIALRGEGEQEDK